MTRSALPDDNIETDNPQPEHGDEHVQALFSADGVRVLYQPMVPLASHDTILGVEALARIDHPEQGVIPPGKFLDVLRDQGLLLDLTKAVLRRIGEDWRQWHSRGHDLVISVNLDYSLLAFTTLSKELSELLREIEVPRRRLMLELSNVTVSELTAEDKEQITRLRMKGFRLSLDNMGGSSLSSESVGELPIDQIKIDRSVVRNLQDNTEAQDSARKVLETASRCGADVVAVGIESEWSLEWLKRSGCRAGQGYLFGPPLAPDAFRQVYLENEQRWSVTVHPDRKSLLVLDDDPQYQVLLFDALGETYNVAVANNIQEARSLFATHHPELLLLDVFLPDGSGVDVCKELISEYGEDAFSTIFVSGKDDVDVRMEAYSAGGVDFIQKPFSMVDLIAKLARVADSHDKRIKLQEQSKQLRDTAMASMREAAHYGDVVQFMKNLFQSHDETGVANELFRFMRGKGLVSSVQFRSPNSTLSLSQDGTNCSPMEINIFELLHQRGRIQDFNQRTIFNDEHVSVLIKNMPDEEGERGRIRDYMAALIEGLEARFTDILRRRLLESVSEELNSLAREVAANLAEDKERNRQIMEKASLDLQMSFHLLSLSEEQELHITQIIETMHKSAEEGEISGARASERLQSLVTLLDKVAELNKSPQPVAPPEEDDDGVELF